MSVDATFAQQFIKDDGLKLIISKIENESWLDIIVHDAFVQQIRMK